MKRRLSIPNRVAEYVKFAICHPTKETLSQRAKSAATHGNWPTEAGSALPCILGQSSEQRDREREIERARGIDR